MLYMAGFIVCFIAETTRRTTNTENRKRIKNTTFVLSSLKGLRLTLLRGTRFSPQNNNNT